MSCVWPTRSSLRISQITHAVSKTDDVTYGCAADQALSDEKKIKNADSYNVSFLPLVCEGLLTECYPVLHNRGMARELLEPGDAGGLCDSVHILLVYNDDTRLYKCNV